MLEYLLGALTAGDPDYIQDARIRSLRERVDALSARRTSKVAFDAERSMGAAVVRLLLKKGLITPEELAVEFEAMEAELLAKIGTISVDAPAAAPAVTIDAEQIAKLDQSAGDPAARIKLDLG